MRLSPTRFWPAARAASFLERLASKGQGATMKVRMARTSTHSIQAQRHFEARSSEVFNRIEFAIRLIALLKPKLKVAVYPRLRTLETARGGVDEPWAMLGVPPHATRENIVRAVAELAGVEEQPFLVDLLRGFR